MMEYNNYGHSFIFADIAIWGQSCISICKETVSKQGCPHLIRRKK